MYELRGQRVAATDKNKIKQVARAACDLLSFGKRKSRSRQTFDNALEKLFLFGITLNVVEDKEWYEQTLGSISGHCDPHSMTISVPERIYEDACMGLASGLEVLLHEIGHLVLGHQPTLHYSSSPPTELEDAEWQADTFAESALEYLGFDSIQKELDFY